MKLMLITVGLLNYNNIVSILKYNKAVKKSLTTLCSLNKAGKLSTAKLNYISSPVDREMLENLLHKLV